MERLINSLAKDKEIIIKGETYTIKTKTWYSTEEDKENQYVKCTLSRNKVLIIIPEDNMVCIGEVIGNMEYKRLTTEKIEYNNKVFCKTGEGHQFITNIEFGKEKEIEGKCIFEDYENGNKVISLGVLTDKNVRADVYANIVEIKDIKI